MPACYSVVQRNRVLGRGSGGGILAGPTTPWIPVFVARVLPSGSGMISGAGREEAIAVQRDNVQALRQQMVRRLPSAAELERRRPLALTPRDAAILAAIATHGFLTAELVDLAFFPGVPVERHVLISRANRRLRRLWLWGLLERIELPISRVLGGRRAFVYALTAQGAAFVAAGLGTPAATFVAPRLDRRDDCFSAHDQRLAALWAQMQAMTHSGSLRACRWTPERELRALNLLVQDPDTGRALPVLPDGYVELEYADGTVQCCMVEIDMGTLELWRFRRKLRALELYLAQGLFSRDWGRRGFEVLVLTTSQERLEHLWQVGRRAVPETAWPWYSFALLEVLGSRERFGGKVWQTLRGDRTGLLYDRHTAGGSARGCRLDATQIAAPPCAAPSLETRQDREEHCHG
jgi:hypothetical protein